MFFPATKAKAESLLKHVPAGGSNEHGTDEEAVVKYK
jgi:hypothetical protein